MSSDPDLGLFFGLFSMTPIRPNPVPANGSVRPGSTGASQPVSPLRKMMCVCVSFIN